MSNRQLLQLLRHHTGIDLSAQAVDAALRRRHREHGSGDPEAYVACVLTDQEELGALIDMVVVPESWFFRDVEAFTAACELVREKATRGRRPVRVLSIPCACGEEPYSLAMALLDSGIDPAAFTIDGMDVSPGVLARAREGVYGANAFRSRDLVFRDRHFERRGDDYALHEEVRRLVRLACGSLFDLHVPDPALRYDIVFCRNLLIYFDQPTQRRAVARLNALLHDDGVLFAGYAETTSFVQEGFRRLPMPRAFALTKAGAAPATTLPPPPDLQRRPHARGPHPQEQVIPARPTVVAAPATNTHTRAQPTHAELLARARLLADRGERSAASEACSAYLKQVPDSADAWFLLGLLHDDAGQDAQAADCLKRAIYLEPVHYDALCHLALLAERSGNLMQAESFRRRAGRVFQRLAGKHT